MPTLTITLPQKDMREVRRRSRVSGYNTPANWARALVEEEIADEKEEKVTEETVLRWSREAKKLKREGRLPVLHSIADLRMKNRRRVV